MRWSGLLSRAALKPGQPDRDDCIARIFQVILYSANKEYYFDLIAFSVYLLHYTLFPWCLSRRGITPPRDGGKKDDADEWESFCGSATNSTHTDDSSERERERQRQRTTCRFHMASTWHPHKHRQQRHPSKQHTSHTPSERRCSQHYNNETRSYTFLYCMYPKPYISPLAICHVHQCDSQQLLRNNTAQ